MPTDRIETFKPGGKWMSKREKDDLTAWVEDCVKEQGLSAALAALWQQQKNIGFILGTPSVGENLENDDPDKFLSKQVGKYWLIHSPARKDRGNIPFLKETGILAQEPKYVWEKLEGGCYAHHPTRQGGFTQVCFLCSAEMANPNEVLIAMTLGDAKFVYGANYATLGHCHFTVWTAVPTLQVYWPKDTLLWLADHGTILDDPEFTTFFNGLGAGNSLKHFHFQTLREEFPIAKAEVCKTFESSGIDRLDWPIPAYRVELASDLNKLKVLSRMDRCMAIWLGMNPDHHTLNLIQTMTSDGDLQIVFIPRVDLVGKRRPWKIGNDFAGCEVGGRINIEDKSEWDILTDEDEETIAGMLESLAPPEGVIANLEAQL